MPRKNSKPRVGRADFVQDQKRQVMQDRRRKRLNTRSARKSAALREYA